MAIDTKQARTDLFGIGKGEAQVFTEQQADLMEREGRREKIQASKDAAQKVATAKKTTAKKKREDSLLKAAADAAAFRTKPGDQAMMERESAAIYDRAVDIVAGGDIDSIAQGNLFRDIAKLGSYADDSAAQYDVIKDQYAKYSEGEHHAAGIDELDRISNMEGGHNLNPALTKVVDVDKAFKEGPYRMAQDRLNNLVQGQLKAITPVDADVMVESWVRSDPAMASSMAQQMLEDPNYTGSKDITIEDVIANQQELRSASLVDESQRNIPQSEKDAAAGIRSTKKPDVTFNPADNTATITPPAEKKDQIHEGTVNGKDVSFMNPMAKFDKDGKLMGGTYIEMPVGAKKQENKIYISNLKSQRSTEIKDALGDQDLIESIYTRYSQRLKELPNPGKTVIITGKNKIDNLIKIAYNIDIEEVLKQRGGEANFATVQTDIWHDKSYVYESVDEYMELNKLRAPRETLRDEWKKGQMYVGARGEINKGSKEKKSSGPSKGDKKTFTQGPATFNGTKWELDK